MIFKFVDMDGFSFFSFELINIKIYFCFITIKQGFTLLFTRNRHFTCLIRKLFFGKPCTNRK